MNPPSCPPPPPFIKGGGGPPKIRGGGCHFFITLQFNPIYCVFVCVFVVEGGGGFPLLLFGSSVFSVSHARFSFKSLLY